jgi:hypothetical protein
MALDPKLYARLQQRQRAKKAQAMGTIGSIITQEGIDYQAPWKRLKEKQDLMDPTLTGIEQSTQFYFGKEYEAQQNALNKQLDIKLENLQAALKEGQMDLTASAQTAANQVTVKTAQYKDAKERREEALKPDQNVLGSFFVGAGMLDAEGEAATGGTGGGGSMPSLAEGPARGLVRRSPAWQEIDRSPDKWYKAESQRDSLIGAEAMRLGITDRLAQAEDDVEAQEILLSAWADDLMANNWVDRSGSLGATAAELAAARQQAQGAKDRAFNAAYEALYNISDVAPELQAGTVSQIAASLGVSPDVLMDMAMTEAATIEQREDLQAVSDAVKAKVFELDEITREKKEDLDQAYRDAIVGIDKGKIRAALDDLQTTLTKLQEASNFGKPVSEEDERTNNFYNILAEPQGPAADKRLEMLQAIEEYEDLPSAQSIKGEIFASPEFQQYMEERQVYDPDIAFKLMNREARAMKQASRSQSRQRVRQLVKEGQLSRQDAASVVETPEAPETPAAQAVADAAADKVASDLAGTSAATPDDQKKKNP